MHRHLISGVRLIWTGSRHAHRAGTLLPLRCNRHCDCMGHLGVFFLHACAIPREGPFLGSRPRIHPSTRSRRIYRCSNIGRARSTDRPTPAHPRHFFLPLLVGYFADTALACTPIFSQVTTSGLIVLASAFQANHRFRVSHLLWQFPRSNYEIKGTSV